jgi:hypothetical protein
MRRLPFAAFLTLFCTVLIGCTASDRDYTRNHIVLLQNGKSPAKAQDLSASEDLHRNLVKARGI